MENSHLGEAAELYATGHLDAAEVAQVEAHAAQCDACLRRLGEAEETVLALERARKPLPPSFARNVVPMPRRGISPWWLAPAIAAALILGMLVPRGQGPHDTATLAMINGHFSHAQFAGTGPKAKAVYARDRSWYYVIVAGSGRYTVYGVSDRDRLNLGVTVESGSTSALFVRSKQRFDHLEILGAGAAERATIR